MFFHFDGNSHRHRQRKYDGVTHLCPAPTGIPSTQKVQEQLKSSNTRSWSSVGGPSPVALGNYISNSGHIYQWLHFCCQRWILNADKNYPPPIPWDWPDVFAGQGRIYTLQRAHLDQKYAARRRHMVLMERSSTDGKSTRSKISYWTPVRWADKVWDALQSILQVSHQCYLCKWRHILGELFRITLAVARSKCVFNRLKKSLNRAIAKICKP